MKQSQGGGGGGGGYWRSLKPGLEMRMKKSKINYLLEGNQGRTPG